MSKIFQMGGLTGGADADLDYINGANLADGDAAWVITDDPDGDVYFYRLDADSGEAENSPYIIAPDTNAGDKRWMLKARLTNVTESLTDALTQISDAGAAQLAAIAAADALIKSSNLSDLDDAATARTNLGLGTSAVLDVADLPGENLLKNSGFDIFSQGTPVRAGGLVTFSDITSGVGTTTDTQDAAPGQLFYFDSGDFSGQCARVDSVVTDTSITFTDTSLTDSGAPGTGGVAGLEAAAGVAFAPDGMSKTSGMPVERMYADGVYGKGLYMMKCTKSSDSVQYLNLNPGNAYSKDFTALCAGRTVALGFWAYSVGAADNIRAALNDGVVTAASDFVSMDTLEWIEVPLIVDSDASRVLAYIVLGGDTGDVAYISEPMLILGSAIGEGNYAPWRGRLALTESLQSALYYTTGFSTAAVNEYDLGVDTQGRIGDGALWVDILVQMKDSGSASGAAGVTFQGLDESSPALRVSCGGLANDFNNWGNGWVPINGGSLRAALGATGSGTLDLYVLYNSVEV